MKKAKIIGFIILIIAIIGFIIFKFNIINKILANFNSIDNLEIEYTTGGGFGPQWILAHITIKIDASGAIISCMDLSKNIDINQKEFSELVTLINKKFYSLPSDLTEDLTMDGGNYTIKVTNKNIGNSYSTGGYAADGNKTFSEIVNLIYKTLGGTAKRGSEIIYEFRKNELQPYLENLYKSQYNRR